MLHNVTTVCVYKGKPLLSAHYMKIGSFINLYIRTKADKSGEHSYTIDIKGSIIENLTSIEEAVATAEELLIENKNFIN